MAITGGMANIVLFAVFQSLWLVTNCHQEMELTGTARFPKSDADWDVHIEEKISLIQMEEPTNKAAPMEWIKPLNSPKNFGIVRMKEHIKREIDPVRLLPYLDMRNPFVEIIQRAVYEDISKEHPNWIVIPFSVSKHCTKERYVKVPHIDFVRDADIAVLLQNYGEWSREIMKFLANNDHVKAAALAHYNGNVEQYATEVLTLDHLMNIWTPTEPVKAWPLAFTPAYQCDETRTITPRGCYRNQLLLKSESEPNDWYTRWNMQTDEVYVWDSRTVAHTAVKIGDGTGERSAISCVLMIVHQNDELLPPITSPPAETLCYTKRFLEIVTKSNPSTAESVLADMGYHRLCDVKPQPGISRLREFVRRKIVGKS